jgi:FG-GAP-like repeat
MRLLHFPFWVVTSLALLPVNAWTQCTICFSAATNYGASSNPYGVASADFNGDNFADIVVANWGASNVSLLSGTGTGSFGAATNFSVGLNPRAIVTADFNADGFKDFATCNDGSVNVSVRLGNGAGGFGAVTNYAVAAAPECIVKADFNGDGIVDLATANYGSLNTSILLGTGTGSFGAATNFSTGASSFPYGLCTADFNLDANSDLVTVSYSFNNLSRLTGNGLGGFGAAAFYGTGSTGAYSVCAADFNGDARPDLAIANANTNNVSRLTGSGTGTFGAATTYAAGSFPFCVISADFNLDSRADLAVANYSSNNVSLLMGQGNGTFCAAVNFGAGSSPTSVCSADFNGDGKPDLAACNNNSNNVSVFLNCTVVLAIEDLSFHCIGKTDNGILLDWETQSEQAIDYFTIERSSDANHFETIGTKEAIENSGQEQHYSFIDSNPDHIIQYYRLTKVNFNGNLETSNTISCSYEPDGITLINIYTCSGQFIRSFSTANFKDELNSIPLSEGLYLIEITNGNERKYVKYFRGW